MEEAIIFLGDLSFQARDTSDLFYQHQVEVGTVVDDLEAEILDASFHVDGFLVGMSGIDTEIIRDLPDLKMLPVELEKGNQEVKIIFRDGEKLPRQYEVIVYLLIEEE